MGEPITAKQAETWIPPLHDVVGNFCLLKHFRACFAHPPEGDANLLVTGIPGSGKTNVILAYLRLRLNNPNLYGDDVELKRKEQLDPSLNEHEARLWQTSTIGKLYAFVQINGGTDKPGLVEGKVGDAMYNNADHTFVLLDEAGELYFRGLEEKLRPMLTAPDVTTFATAQNFHSKRRTDSRQEDDDRLRAFLRRFSHQFSTENPTSRELILFLARRMRTWDITLENNDPAILRLAVLKSGCVVGYALSYLVKAIDNDRTLTWDLVESHNPDPLR